MLKFPRKLEVESGLEVKTATPHLGPFHSVEPGHNQSPEGEKREKYGVGW